ncbi:hypothetical protein [Dankookia sp. P2]|uniref:hypothetical protein n=1 Tax=Dankookia sp. P2 TaxID=3423955 RepID=UPI003D66DB4C
MPLALAAVVALNLPLGTVYAFSVFIRPLEAELGLSRAALSFVFGLAIVGFTLGMNCGPLLYRLAPAPLLLAGSAALATLGMALAALAEGSSSSRSAMACCSASAAASPMWCCCRA